ncbi:MAG: HAMP domain-containing histidine kinase [Eubacterium sp.]|nr:HAMP domain-containing histidine kinase [Eubacterium sp.]
MSSKDKSKKRSYKNLKINTRIIITSLLGIIIPLLLVTMFSGVTMNTVATHFNFSSVTTNTYSTINQIQWSQTLYGINSELINDNSDNKKLEEIKAFVSPLEKFGTQIRIEKNGEIFYQTKTDTDILETASTLVNLEEDKNLNYFGDDGLVIVNHATHASERYSVIIVNNDYTVNDVSIRSSAKDITSTLVGRTGLIALVIVLLFVISIVVISFITSQTIVKPIKKISKGAEEIARGNLDYEIEFNSTNELGQTVENFNNMRIRLKQSIDDIQSAQSARQAVVAGIAHDLRTPLTSVRGYAEGLRDGIANTPEKQRQYTEIICESINNTEKILDDLLTISKLELNGFELDKEDVNAKEFFEDGVAELKQVLDAAGFDFTHSCHCSDDTVISIDTDRFERVISNVISNSIKYARENVKGSVHMALSEYERTVIIEISDNGIGVDRQSLPKIFDMMYRADPARTRVAKGSGLGLSVCKQIVELHGGTIWATSRSGHGLSIFISMPKRMNEDEEKNTDN